MGQVGRDVVKDCLLRPGVYQVRSPVNAFTREVEMARPKATVETFIITWWFEIYLSWLDEVL